MNVHISYKMAKAPDVEREFSHHIAKLKKRVQVYRPELVHLHGIVDQNSSSRGEMMISLNLRLPSGQLAAQESGPTAVAAMNSRVSEALTVRRLAAPSKKRLMQRRRDYDPQRVPFPTPPRASRTKLPAPPQASRTRFPARPRVSRSRLPAPPRA